MQKLTVNKRTITIASIATILLLLILYTIPAMGLGEKNFYIKKFTPTGEIQNYSEIEIEFNKEVVTKEKTGKEIQKDEMPIIFTPSINGKGKWTNTKTFLYTPKGGKLAPATSYTATAVPTLKDIKGKKLTGTQSYEFHTSPLKFISASQTNYNRATNTTQYELTFSHPVSPSRLRGYINVTPLKSGEEYRIADGPVSTKIKLFITSYGETKELKIKLTKGLPTEVGALGLEKDETIKLLKDTKMGISYTKATANISGGEIYIETTAPADLSKIASFIELEPKTKYTIEPRENGIAIKGKFNSQDRVIVTIKKGLPAIGGTSLKEEWKKAFIFPDKETEIKLSDEGRILTYKDSMRIPIETVNVDKINLYIWKLYENNIPLGMRDKWNGYPKDLSAIIAEKQYKVKAKRNQTTKSAIDLNSILKGQKGIFLISAQNEDVENWAETNQIINITDLGVTFKKGTKTTNFWINSIKTGKAISGATVTLWSWSNQPLATGKTKSDGTVEIEYSQQNEQPTIVTVKKDDDITFIRLENGLFDSRDGYEATGTSWVTDGYYTYGYMARDIYRPGEQMKFNIIVRDKEGKAPKQFPVKIKVQTPTNKIWTTQTAKLTKYGTAEFIINTTTAAPTGTWFITVHTGATDISYTQNVMVEEFVAPRLFVETQTNTKTLTKDQGLKIDISSKYAFGSPASELPYEIKLNSEQTNYTHEKWKGYDFKDSEAKFRPIDTVLTTGKLNETGQTKYTTKPEMTDENNIVTLNYRTGVMEESGRWVYKTDKITWFPTTTILGIKTPREMKPGTEIKIQIAAITKDGIPSPSQTLDYTLYRTIERGVIFTKDGRTETKTEKEYIERTKGKIKVKDGKGTIETATTEGGTYLIKVTDKTTGATINKQLFVYGDKTENSAIDNKIKITTDKKQYKIGETAKVTIDAPFTGTLMLNVETNKVVYSKVVKIKHNKEEIKIKTNKEMAPNGWITAQLIRPQEQENDGIIRAYGLTKLAIDMTDKQLTIETPKQTKIKPGKNNFTLQVKDSKGKGTKAEVTVMLVDETILNMSAYKTPNPWEYYSGQKELGVDTYDIYNVLIKPDYGKLPLLTAGGGAADMYMRNSSLSPVQAKRFKMLSLAKKIETDNTGKCNYTFVLPEFAGTARLMAVAVTDTESGKTEQLVEIGREIVVEPTLPKAMAPKDEITAPCLIYNKSDRDEKILLEITTKGNIKLTGENKINISLKKDETKTIPLKYTAQGTGKATVTYIARSSKNATKETIEMPVRPITPKTTETQTKLIKQNATVKLTQQGKWYSGTYKGTALISAMPTVNVNKLTKYLMTYPYGCLEQTVSATWPILVMPEMTKTIDPLLANKNAQKTALNKTIQKITSLQNYDGGFVTWQGETWSQPWESIYATHFLTEAKKAGIKTAEEPLEAAQKYIRSTLSHSPENPNNDREWKEILTRKAYACYVLALAGDAPLGWMESIRDRKSELDPSGRLLLASAYAVAGYKKDATKLITKTIALPNGTKTINKNYDSDLRNEALLLLANTHINPNSAESASQALTLLEKIEKEKNINTQEAGLSLLALSKYFESQPTTGTPSGQITVNGKAKGTINENNKTVIIQTNEKDEITVQNRGKTKLFISWINEGITLKEIKNENNGIEMTVTYKDTKGKTIGNKITKGQNVIAEITIKPTIGKLNNVVAVMPLASGLETENPTFTNRGEVIPEGIRVEARDDRTILFITKLEKPLKWKVSLRAVTEGNYTIPSSYAECMYQPGINSHTATGKLYIK
ncbi:MAG: MG2 domain-containing protein [Synergistaceae bacterium]